MVQKLISLPDRVQIVERGPKELTNKVVAELSDIIRRAGNRGKAIDGPKAAYLAYSVPFAGVRYYSYE